MRSRRISINDGEQIFSRSKLLMFTQNSAFVSANRNSSVEKRTIDVNSFGHRSVSIRGSSSSLISFPPAPYQISTRERANDRACLPYASTLDEKHYSPRCSNEVRGRSFRDKTDAFLKVSLQVARITVSREPSIPLKNKVWSGTEWYFIPI